LASLAENDCKNGHRGIPESLRKGLPPLPAFAGGAEAGTRLFTVIMGSTFQQTSKAPAKGASDPLPHRMG